MLRSLNTKQKFTKWYDWWYDSLRMIRPHLELDFPTRCESILGQSYC